MCISENKVFSRKYYHAYDDRYLAIHEKNVTWAGNLPTPIVMDVVKKYAIDRMAPILEIGCGEGRDSIALLKNGYSLTATDVSAEAIRYCKEQYAAYYKSFSVLDACDCNQDIGRFDFIFATAVLHMLVEEKDRNRFLDFFYRHLNDKGKALILTMGNGTDEFRTDPSKAFEIQQRDNNSAQIPVLVTNTSCAMVSFETLNREVRKAGLKVIESGITESLPDFTELMYVVVERQVTPRRRNR